ncbi:MAG TPA: DsbA family protein, partial [Alphaproteobacteria bacterium]|nr:DsbA family protein [Alphaproteobacteria bacterium]
MPLKLVLSTFVIVFCFTSGPSANALDEPVLGDLDAPVTIIEFASLSCPHCAAFHKERFPWLKKNFIDTGKVRFIFRDFPLNRAALLGSMV